MFPSTPKRCFKTLLPTWLVAQPNSDWRLISWLLSLEIVALSLCAIYFVGGKPWVTHFAFSICFILVLAFHAQRLNHDHCMTPKIDEDWRRQCLRQLERPLADRLRFGWFRTYKPVLDDATYRSFSSMAEYRDWCEKHLPAYLGYGTAPTKV